LPSHCGEPFFCYLETHNSRLTPSYALLKPPLLAFHMIRAINIKRRSWYKEPTSASCAGNFKDTIEILTSRILIPEQH
jgi:hypothetical protein